MAQRERPEKDEQEAIERSDVQFIFKEAKDLVRALEGTATSRLTIRSGAFEIEVERAGAVIVAGGAGLPTAPAAAAPAPPSAAEPGLAAIVAPLVGVCYTAPSPGAAPFVQVGDTVERGQQVAIVEAMKVMNEVVSDCRGVVTEILVENGEAVQYEQPLILVDPSARTE